MSGVEIAGLALSVLPVLFATISQIETYRRNPRRVEFMENLGFEIGLLHVNLESLAKSLNELPHDTRESLLSPQGADGLESAWRSSDVVYALKARLGSEHETFLIKLGVIMDCLEELLDKKSLGLSKEETFHTRHTYEKLRTFLDKKSSTPLNSWNNRARFFFKEARECEQILSNITRNNTQLEKIVSWNKPLPVLEPLRANKPVEYPHTQLRPLVHALHAALKDSWQCDSHREHEARLCLLEQRERRRDSMISELKRGDRVYFDLSMSLSNGDTEPCCRWLESQLCITLQQDVAPQPTQGVRFELGLKSSPVDLGCSAGTAETLIESTAATSARHRTSTETRKEVRKMCDTLLKAERYQCSPQILFDAGFLWHVDNLPLSRSSLPNTITSTSKVDTSIASLLQSGRKFKQREKRILPVVLANSLLHFCESSWIGEDWSKEHISFFLSPGNGELEIQRPYLSTKFRNVDPEDDPDAMFRLYKNSSLLALGILLLEIELGSPIGRVRAGNIGEEDVDVNADYLAALKLFERDCDQLFENHRQAVSACLYCDFYDQDMVEPSLNNPEFRQAVYENIVRPLEKDMQHTFNLTLETLHSGT